MDEYLEANQRLWERWTEIHEGSEFYDLQGFIEGGEADRDAGKRGGVRLRDYEIEEVGPVEGKSLLHLQCHFGIDTLSWARLGATVTGADFSAKAVELARSLAERMQLPASFVCSDIHELPANLQGEFDVVYTSRGVLMWLPDIDGWARVVAHFVKPGGVFYISEVHPVALAFETEGVEPGELRLTYPYFEHREPLTFPVQGSYADPDAPTDGLVEHGWAHGLGEIVSALIKAGLRIEFLHEFPFIEWPVEYLTKRDDGTWRLPQGHPGELPLFFSLRASKPGPV